MDGREVSGESWWRRHMAQQSCSGLSVHRYCLREGVSEGSFYYWRRRLGVAAEFAEVRVTSGDRSDSGVWLELTCGTRLHVERGFDEETLGRVLSVVGQAR